MNYSYLLQRVLFAVFVIFGVTVAVFSIVQLIPGDPARVVLGVQANEETVAVMRGRMGLDRPLLEQYTSWVGGVLQGDFGNSLITAQPVGPQLWSRFLPTLQLAILSLIIGLLIAFPLGIISAMYPRSPIDFVASIISQIGVSIPDFWLGILLILLFSLTLGWLPPSGYTPFFESPLDWLSHLIMPAITAGLISGSIQTRFIRSAMLEVLNENYIRTAHAKGLKRLTVIRRHALQNAMITIITIIGLQMTALFSAVVVVEIVFALPGLGKLSLDAVLDRDYPMLQGSVLVIAVIVTTINLIVDMLYFFLDPRIEYA
ncbi:MAG: ABC transporter permease [Anaerolineae bacterium]